MLITGRELDYSITDIAEQAGIGRATFYRMLDGMLKDKVIFPTKKHGNMQLYKLNQDNKIIKRFVELYDQICKTASEKEIAIQKKKIKVKIKK